jgi:hypothetical protein
MRSTASEPSKALEEEKQDPRQSWSCPSTSEPAGARALRAASVAGTPPSSGRASLAAPPSLFQKATFGWPSK